MTIMNRPSHWILGFFAVVGGTLWWTGALKDYLAARPADPPRRVESDPRSVAVKHTVAPPKPQLSEVGGTIVDRRGWPVVAAKVRLIGGGEAETAETDAYGRFRIRGPGAMNRILRVEAPGRHAPMDVHGSVESLALVMQDALPWTEPETAVGQSAAVADDLLVGEGWVRDSAGEAVAGASVVVRETGASTRTDETGRYVLPLPSGAHTFVAWSTAGEVAVTDTVVPPRKQGKLPLPDLHLARGNTLRGRLRDDDGQSLVGAAIVIENAGVRRTVRTEQGGLFVATGIATGDLRVSVLPVRGHVGRRIAAVVDGDADLGEIVLARAEREPLRIQVVDPDGVPRPFVHVVADQAAGLCRAYGQADAHGVVVLAALGSGETRFEVRDTDLEPVNVVSWDELERRLAVAR